MTGARRRGLAMALMLGTAGLAAVPAPAFEIFGIHLWGEREEDEAIEVIDPLPYAVTWRVAGGEEPLQDSVAQAGRSRKRRPQRQLVLSEARMS